MAGETESSLRAWVEYYRDLGVYDFYRRGEAAFAAADEAAVSDAVEEAGLIDVPTPIAAEVSPPDISTQYVAPETQTLPSSDLAAAKLISFNDLAPLPAARVPVAERGAALLAIQQEIGDCTRCPLAYAGRRKIVFGDGTPSARLMFIGEGPGAEEDRAGKPLQRVWGECRRSGERQRGV